MITSRQTVTRAAAAFVLAATVAGLTGGIAAAAEPTGAAPTATAEVLPDRDPADPDPSDQDPAGVGPVRDGAAGPETAEGEMHAAAHRDAVVQNQSGYALRLKDISGDHRFGGPIPAFNTTIGPGQSQTWPLMYDYLRKSGTGVTYELLAPDGSVDGELIVDMVVSPVHFFGDFDLTVTTRSFRSASGLEAAVQGDTVMVRDKPGTVRYLDGSGPNAVAAGVLQQLCDSGMNDVSCTFEATAEQRRLGPAERVGKPLANTTDRDQSKSVAIANTQGSSDTVGGSVSLKIPIAPVELTIQSTYNHSWTQSRTWTETMPIITPPKHWGWIEMRTHYFEHTGNFTVTYGNTTWHIQDVTITSPDPAEDAGVIIARNAPMTEQELADAVNSDWSGRPLQVELSGLAGR